MKYTVKAIIELCRQKGIIVNADAVRQNIKYNLDIPRQGPRGEYRLTEKQKDIVMAHCKGGKGRIKKKK